MIRYALLAIPILAGCSKPNLRAVWLHGYGRGYAQGAMEVDRVCKQSITAIEETCSLDK